MLICTFEKIFKKIGKIYISTIAILQILLYNGNWSKVGKIFAFKTAKYTVIT